MKGFTLIELIVSISIFLILIFVLFSMMGSGTSAWFTGSRSVELRQEIIKVFMKMEVELQETRPAQISLSIGSTSPALTFKIPQDNDNDGTILDSFGNVEWSNNITYALNGANQITRTASGATTILANSIITLQFTRPTTSVSLLQIDVTAHKTIPSGRIIQDSGQIIRKMRN
jgi:prepilin-type N-terminal cleavage/methylation domain-containing protein